MTLVQFTIQTHTNGPVEIIGERITDNFAITPAITGENDEIGLTDRLNLTHIRSGRTISWSMWLDLRGLARDLETLPIDWAAVTGNNLTTEQRAMVVDTIKEAQRDYANCDPDEFPKWAGDPDSPALSLLGTLLDDEAKQWARFQSGRELASEVAAVDANLGRKVEIEISWRTAAANVNGYGTAYLLAVLHRIDPEAADRAARNLASAWECGDSLGEWLAQWQTELVAGQPLTLHGFADIDLPTEVDQ